MTRIHGHLLFRLGIPLGPLLALFAQANAATNEGEVTMLDPVFVEASTGNPWRYFSGSGFEVISHCPDGFNEAFTRALQKEAATRLALLPAGFWGELAAPITIVLYNRPPELKAVVGPASPIDLAWAPEDGSVAGSDSVELSHPLTVGDGDTFINCGNYWNLQSGGGDLSADPDSAILLEKRVPRLPAWFIAGLEGPRGLFVNRVVRSTPLGDFAVLSNAIWVSYADTIAIQDESRRKDRGGAARRHQVPLALADLFRGAIHEDQRDAWNAEAALFVRWGLYKSGDRQAFLDFVDEAARQPATESMFRRHFGAGYDDVRQRLGDYLPAAVSEQIRVPIAEQPQDPLEAREATPSEVARIIGGWGRMEGRNLGPQYSEYRRECLEQADRLFARAVARKSNDPLLLAAYGLYALQVGDEPRAFGALEAATQAGVVRPRAYVELARMRLERALPAVQQGIGDLGEAEFEGILDLLTTARLQMPSLVGCYTVLAQTLEHAPRNPLPEELLPLDRALGLFPQNAQLAYRLATLYMRLGDAAKASAIIDRATSFSESEQARALLATFPAPRGSRGR